MSNSNRDIDYAMYSCEGERTINEDYISDIKDDNGHYFLLADGLGGHGLGNLASQFVVEGLKVYLSEKLDISEALCKIQKDLLEEQIKHGYRGKMKTTVTVLAVRDNSVEYAHVGDSRIYHFHKLKLIDRTMDHSVCQKLVEAKMIREKDIRHHPDRSKLLKVMGEAWKDEKIDNCIQAFDELDAYLLCSDGFWENITEKEMVKCLKKSKDAKEWLDKMSAIVIKKGTGTNMDNYSCIVVLLK